MPRKSTGTVILHGDHFDVRVTLSDGRRSPRMHLPAELSEEQARAVALRLAEQANRGELTAPTAPPGESVSSWFARWFADRAARGIVTAEGEHGRFLKWIAPLLGDKPIVDVTTRDLEAVVEVLDRAARAHAEAESAGRKPDRAVMCSWKTAFNLWGIVRQGFSDARHSKTLALRVLEKNPAEGIRGPDTGARKARTYLTPTTFLAFVTNAEVPILWRRVVTLAVYTYLRASELRALEWRDVHLDEGFILVHQTRDAAGKRGTTKSERSRRVPIEPALRPLLEALRREREATGTVTDLVDDRHLARALRTWLRLAGLASPEHSSTATTAGLTWHDLRATGITWRAIRGDDPFRIMKGAGHADMETTMRYVRDADEFCQGFGAVFPELPGELMSNVASNSRPKTPRGSKLSMRNHERILVEAAGIEPASARFLMHPRSRA
jgi:integrase